MESVWWVFKTLVEKNLVYRGYKVMPFSTACATPLSNFEAGLNYKDVQDPAVVVAFPLKDDPEVCAHDVRFHNIYAPSIGLSSCVRRWNLFCLILFSFVSVSRVVLEAQPCTAGSSPV